VLSLYFSALGQFFISLGAQILLWRAIRRADGVVPGQIMWLFLLFLAGPIVHFLFAPDLSRLILALGLGCVYIMSFPAAAAKSPTLLIIDLLDRHGALSKSELEKYLNADVSMVEDRLRDLKADGLVDTRAEKFRPSATGRLIGYVFWYYRRVLGLPLGEG